MISVIVPIYNAEKHLYRCINSILAQSYTNFELLLIDDGSTDGSGVICDEYAKIDSRVRVFHKKNGGVSSARNLGLDKARGEYITFCDSDDYVGEEWLMSYRGGNDETDLVIQGVYHVRTTGEVEVMRLSPCLGNSITEKRKLIVLLMNQGVYGYPVTKLFCRRIIEENRIRFDMLSSFREDEQFFSQYLLYVNTYECVDEVNYYYYMPSCNKIYLGDRSNSLLPTLMCLDEIFDENLPKEVCESFYVLIKDCVVEYITQGKKISLYHIDLYRRMSSTLVDKRSIKHALLDFIVLKSFSHPLISKCILRLIHSIMQNR